MLLSCLRYEGTRRRYTFQRALSSYQYVKGRTRFCG
jgi:hypothetical protein